jgi:hypothetical protein
LEPYQHLTTGWMIPAKIASEMKDHRLALLQLVSTRNGQRKKKKGSDLTNNISETPNKF